MRNFSKFQIHRFLLVLISALFINSNLFATTKLSESFTGTTFPPTGWVKHHEFGLFNAGDWHRSTSNFKSAPGCAESSGGLLGDNWLVTSQIAVTAGDSLVFYVSSNYLITALGRLEIKVSTTNQAVASFFDFIIPLQITLGLLTPNVYFRRAVSLNTYAGQNIYIGFRHIEVAGLFGDVRLDNVNVGGYDVLLTSLFEGHVAGNLGQFTRDRDTAEVTIRSAVTPFPILESRIVFLDTLGKKTLNWTMPEVGQSCYIVVQHRNSIRTWSRSGGEVFSGTINYDFTAGINMAFGDNMKLVNGRSLIFTGDINFDEVVDGTDNAAIENDAFNFVSGSYVITDLNWDEFVDGSDFALADNNAFLLVVEEAP